MAGSTNNSPPSAPTIIPGHEGALFADDKILPVRQTPPPQVTDAALSAVIGSLRGVRGLFWSREEREFLGTVYVEAALNAEVVIDQRLETFK